MWLGNVASFILGVASVCAILWYVPSLATAVGFLVGARRIGAQGLAGMRRLSLAMQQVTQIAESERPEVELVFTAAAAQLEAISARHGSA